MSSMLDLFNKYKFPINFIRLFINLRERIIIILSTLLFKLKLKSYSCSYGKNLKVNGRVYLKLLKKNLITIGNDVTINSRFPSNLVGITNYTVFQIIDEGRILIGNNCGITSTIFSSRSNIEIGPNVKIGANVRIFDHDFHSLDYMKRRNTYEDRKFVKTNNVIIGDDVFIGTNSIILKGVRIGPRSIIGAGSVVSLKEIPPDSLVAGNPAKILDYLKEDSSK